jgi:hypothetical protein
MARLESPEELAKIRELLGETYAAGKYDDAAGIFASSSRTTRSSNS